MKKWAPMLAVILFLSIVTGCGGLSTTETLKIAGQVLTGTSEADRALAEHHNRGGYYDVKGTGTFYYIDGTKRSFPCTKTEFDQIWRDEVNDKYSKAITRKKWNAD